MKILLVYNDYFVDGVGIATSDLSGEDINKVYHVQEDDCEEFIKRNGPFAKILFTKKISDKKKLILSKSPYNGKQME